jgi:3-ketosteroid 9alpha-monooxygenase subunit B
MSGAVAAVWRETHDTVTLELTADGAAPAYRAGHFLTIDPHQFPQIASAVSQLEALRGRTEPPRAYSLSSAPHEPALAITIKEEAAHAGAPPALLSPLLIHHLPPGSKLTFKGFDGLYTLPEDVDEHDLLLHLCSGSGIVPNFGLMKEALHRGFHGRQMLLYESRTRADIIFDAQLKALETAHPRRIAVRHFIEQAPAGELGHFGRAEIEQALAKARAPLLYLCGPGVTSWAQREARETGIPPAPRFIERIRADLKSIGLDRHQLRTEIFG